MACATAKSAVVIPAVRKGLCNQRVRMVQDVMLAHLFGAAVVLPEVVFSRQSCNFGKGCGHVSKYTGEVPFGNAYDTANTTRALAAAGICVLSGEAAAARFGAPALVLATAARLGNPAIVLPVAVSELNDAAPWVSGKVDGLVWSTADAATCCTLVVPDSETSIGLLRQVNAAFLPAARVASKAEMVLKRFYERAQGRERATHGAPPSSCVPIAIHWRGQADMATSSHALNVEAYTLEAARLLARMREQPKQAEPGRTKPAPASLCLLVLGGLSASELADLQVRLTSAFERVGGTPGGTLRLFSKETLLPKMKWSAWFGGYDDLVGMVDLEIARRATAFVGSPFSSFSVVAAALRRVPSPIDAAPSPPVVAAPSTASAQPLTEMVPVDVVDQLGRVYAMHFPYADEEPEDRCETLAALHDWKKPGGEWSCPTTRLHKKRSSALDPYLMQPRPRHPQCEVLGTSLRVSPPVDAPSRLGYNCTHSVVTALYGGYDKLFNYSHFFQASLERQEREQGIRTCWFAFTDAASVPELSAKQATLAEAAFGGRTEGGLPWIKAGIWNLVILPEGPLTAMLPERNKLRSRLPKMMAHCALRYSHQMLYLDAKVSIRKPASLWQMLNQLSDGTNSKSGSAWVSPLHSARVSVRDEMVCLYQSGISSRLAFEQLRAYHAAGFPSNVAASQGGPGLSEGEWHARDLRAADSTAIGNAWFTEFWRWSQHNLRDQISFNYVVWQLGLLPSQQPNASAAARTGSGGVPAQVTENGESRGFGHFQAGGGNQSLSPARSGRKSRLLLVHNVHAVEHKRDSSTEDRFIADKFGRYNLDWKALRNLKQGHQWCDYLKFGLDNTKLLSKVSSLLEG